MRWGIDKNDPSRLVRILIKKTCRVYYLRWYYNGWHYWAFLPGKMIQSTEGEKYRTIGTRKIGMGSGQVTPGQIQAIRSIMNTREVHLLTSAGWMNIRIEPASVIVKNNQVDGYEMDFIALIGSREISYTDGFSPVEEIPAAANYCDWFLPSQYELNQMWYNLHRYGIGNFVNNGNYYSSTELGALYSFRQRFDLPSSPSYSGLKNDTLNVRACRFFTSTKNYNLRDIGPAGGFIFYRNGDNYLEATHEDQSASQAWSNIDNVLIGTTGSAIGAGQANTNAIIAQAGHINSAAKLCDDFCSILPNIPTYCEIIIGTQIWMCKNWDIDYPGSKVYDNDEANRTIFGGLYSYNQIMNPGFCPAGWHVATFAEWDILRMYLGGNLTAGGHLKEVGTTHWDAPNTGAVDTYGFAARGAGYYNIFTSGFHQLHTDTYFWLIADEGDPGIIARFSYLSGASDTIAMADNHYMSVRLIKDTPHIPIPYDDWFLPSKDELNAMYTELYLYGLGGFVSNRYGSSSERGDLGYDNENYWCINFDSGIAGNYFKYITSFVRACRSFTAGIGEYSLRDTGPSGGLIFHILGTTYLEAAIIDTGYQYFSNIYPDPIGTTGTAIGEGQNNTNEIIAQAGHTDSAAKLCDDLIIYH